MAAAYDANPKPFGAKQQCVGRDNHGARQSGQLEMNMHIGSGKQLPGGIVDVYFRIQRSRCHVDGLRGPGNLAVEGLAGKFIQRQSRRGADPCRVPTDAVRQPDDEGYGGAPPSACVPGQSLRGVKLAERRRLVGILDANGTRANVSVGRQVA